MLVFFWMRKAKLSTVLYFFTHSLRNVFIFILYFLFNMLIFHILCLKCNWFIFRFGSNCLSNVAETTNRREWDAHLSRHPGQLYSVDDVCKQVLGPSSYMCRVRPNQNGFQYTCRGGRMKLDLLRTQHLMALHEYMKSNFVYQTKYGLCSPSGIAKLNKALQWKIIGEQCGGYSESLLILLCLYPTDCFRTSCQAMPTFVHRSGVTSTGRTNVGSTSHREAPHVVISR